MKRSFIFLSAAVLCGSLLTGCGTVSSDEQLGALAYNLSGAPTDRAAEATVITVEQPADTENAPVDAAAGEPRPLPTDGDTFHLMSLCYMMHTPDSGVIEMLGPGVSPSYDADGMIVSRSYQGTLYSHNARFTFFYNYGIVESIDAEFDGTDAGIADYAASLSDTLGSQPVEGYLWNADGVSLALEAADGRTLLHISQPSIPD